ncbi:Hypothetical protein HVR_LOCUS249 [uncultured virus]|nr:Hypothetical protein HVR_LOCUS249 [uncultured virus]
MNFEETSLFPYFLGQIDTLNTEGLDTYEHGIVWTTRYPRKLDGEKWIREAGGRLSVFTTGMAFLDEMTNPSVKLNVTGYPNGGILSFLVVHGPKSYEFYYNPASEQKFHKV